MISFDPDFIDQIQAWNLYNILKEDTEWRQDIITIYGKKYNIPRLQQWYGEGKYTWSGISLNPLPWTSTLLEIKEKVERKTGSQYNSVLLNYYRDGKDTVGWHSDNEPELGKNPKIASISFGAARDFVLRKIGAENIKQIYSLTNGSLLVMEGETQEEWQHCLPRRKKVKKGRINLTFRDLR